MASSYLQKFPVPEAFPEILNDLIKNILKEQPADIIEHSYHYFKNKHEGDDAPTAERKNYYGNQIQKQIVDRKAEVIKRPTPAQEAENLKKVDGSKNAKLDAKVGAREDNGEEGNSSERAQSHHSNSTNQTKKIVATEFVGNLVDEAIEIFETMDDNNGGARPKTTGEARAKTGQTANSKNSQPDPIQEEDEEENMVQNFEDDEDQDDEYQDEE